MIRHRFNSCFCLFLALALIPQSLGQMFVKHSKTYPVGPNPCAIVAVDLNGDTLPEIVTADRGQLRPPHEEKPANDELSLLVASESLSYTSHPPLRSGFGPYCIAAANIDAIPALDLLVGNFHAVSAVAAPARHLVMFRNLRNNQFEELSFTVPMDSLTYKRGLDGDGKPIFTVPGITAVAVGDLNGDGYRDAVATGWSADVLIVFMGHPEKYFESIATIPAQGGPRDIQLADLNDDGKLDAVTTQYSNNEIAVWKGDGNGGLSEVERFRSRGELPHKVRIADMDGDGTKDVVVSHCHASDSVHIGYGDGSFRFAVSQEILLGADRRVVEEEVRDLIVSDLNNDGRQDIVLACFASSRVSVMLNVTPSRSMPIEYARENYSYKDARPRAICTADFNQDGKLDIGVALWQANSVGMLLAR
ncbi:MAG: hypothetical protein AMXMBFR84_15940 [Candidatus Hydrogenedentota bacterium]